MEEWKRRAEAAEAELEVLGGILGDIAQRAEYTATHVNEDLLWQMEEIAKRARAALAKKESGK